MAIGGFFSGLGDTLYAAGRPDVYFGNIQAQKLAEQKALQEQKNQQAQQQVQAIMADKTMTPDQKLQAMGQINHPAAFEYIQQATKPVEQITPYQREQLALERAKLENSAEFQQQQSRQRAQALELQARQLEAAGRRQEAAAVRQEAVAAASTEPRKLSATEQKEFYEAEDRATAATGVIGALDAALQLNDKAFSGVTADARAWANRLPIVGALIPDEGAYATTDLSNIILGQALESLKVTFGAAPTEGERKILIDLQASVDKLPAEREAILKRAKAAAERREKASRAKMQGIVTGGIYGNATPPVAEDSPLGGLNIPDASAIEAELRRRGVM